VAVLVKNRSRMIEIELAIGELHIVLQYAYWNSLYIDFTTPQINFLRQNR
jgi:hypothetical protein